jgi:hypothetical protein
MSCASNWGNTGTTGNACDIKQIKGFIIVPENVSYTKATYDGAPATFRTKLGTDALAAIKSQRIYPYFFVQGMTDNTAANAVQTGEYGGTLHVENGKPTLQFRLDERGHAQITNLFKFHGNSGLRVMLLDKGGKLIGEHNIDNTTFTGHCVKLDVEYKLPQGTNTSDKFLNIRYEDEEAFLNSDKLDFYDFGNIAYLKDNLSGIHDVRLELVSASTSSIVIKAKLAATNEDMGDLGYSAAVGQAAALLLVLNSTGAAVNISSVTYSSTAKTYALAGTFTTAPHKLSLKDPTALAAMNPNPLGNSTTGGFESNVLDVTPA